MPLRDGTGPRGKGPRTGRGLGNCAPVRRKRKTVSNSSLRRKRRKRK